MNSVVKHKNVMIIGAGWTGSMLAERLINDKNTLYNVKCLIDDNVKKIGSYIENIPIVGDRYTITNFVSKFQIEVIIIALPSVNKIEIRKIIEICKTTNCEIKCVPNIYEINELDIDITRIRNIAIEDLLGRSPVVINNKSIKSYISNSIVVVTGAGGSIGSELVRQIAINKPKQLILIDIYENSLYDLEQELLSSFKFLNFEVLIASVRNEKRIQGILKKYNPDIVFHAAAHKHVPLMENSPNEAIKNNVFGTYNVAKASAENSVKKFILISTDKAVNPTNIMGASKRICEMIIQMLDSEYKNTDFAAVRFGNVLGSNGSVVPLFKKQILNGGPVTVTHPDVIRYFMTIPEAVSLVLQAGVYAHGGEIFVLDMGEPVKILDLAKNLIRLAGFTEEEIQIKFTGLRPGEKMYEELLMKEENMKTTDNDLIFIENPIEFNDKNFRKNLKKLQIAANEDNLNIREIVKEIVPTYNFT